MELTELDLDSPESCSREVVFQSDARPEPSGATAMEPQVGVGAMGLERAEAVLAGRELPDLTDASCDGDACAPPPAQMPRHRMQVAVSRLLRELSCASVALWRREGAAVEAHPPSTQCLPAPRRAPH